MYRCQLLNLILASAAFALPFCVSATQIRNARLWRSDDKLRIVLDLSGPMQLASFLLPPRSQAQRRLVHLGACRCRTVLRSTACPRVEQPRRRRVSWRNVRTAQTCWALPAGVILDMSMNATIAASLQLGSTVLGSLAGITTLHQKRVEQAEFAVLKSPDVLSIQVEIGFISNARDSQRLVNAHHQQAAADGLFEGLQRYFQKNPPVNSYIAWQQEQKKSQA